MEWFERWFQEEYDKIYVNRNEQQAVDQVDALLKAISLPAYSLVLDIGCGKGRHLKRLVEKKQSAIGIDLSYYLLSQAQKVHSSLARADMRHIPFRRESFDMVCSFFTSFGYFETRDENMDLIRVFSEMVKPGGYLFLDLMNKEAVVKTLPKKDTTVISGRTVTQDRYFKKNCVCKEITIENESNIIEKYNERVMVFETSELYDIFKRYKLTVITIFGNESGDEFSPESPRMSFVLKKGV